MKQKEYNIMAILGFILSFFIPVAGLILSIIALIQMKKEPHRYEGKGFAIAGLFISIAFLLLLLFFIFFILSFFFLSLPFYNSSS